jgi:hypothetical protein
MSSMLDPSRQSWRRSDQHVSPIAARHLFYMQRLMMLAVGPLILIVLTACGGMSFARYEGEARAWPTGSSFADKVFDVPVYRGWPERAYDVVGFIQFDNPNVDWNQGDTQFAARKAKESGGDALILMPKGADPSPTAAAARKQLGIDGSRTVGVVVKWK